MEINEIKELLDYIEKSTFVKVEIKVNNDFFHLEKEKNIQEIGVDTCCEIGNLDGDLYKSIDEDIKIIKSPMVGTFHIPETVILGQEISKGDVVAVIEAMKLMNEVESNYDGEIIEFCVKNNSIVGYGDNLIKIRIK